MGFRFPALVSPFRSVNENDSEGCLSAKGCGGGLSPFWGSFIAAAIVSQSGSLLPQTAQILVFIVVYQKRLRIFARSIKE